MDPKIYQVAHLVTGFLLVAVTFRAFAAPTPETRKSNLMGSGILAVLMLVAGFGLAAKLQYSLSETWLLVKIGCWFLLASLAGIAYRAPKMTGLLTIVAAALVIIAVVMVYVVNPRVAGLG